MTVIGSIQDFWFKVVTLPPKSSTLKKMDWKLGRVRLTVYPVPLQKI
jgi:hypothetical protein